MTARFGTPDVYVGEWCDDVDHGAAVNALCMSADGATLITAGADGTVRVWDITTRNEALKV